MIFDIIKYAFLGIVQGITEPLPISSSGHLVLFRYLLTNTAFEDISYEILLNFASFIAIFFLFRKDIFKLIKSFFTYIFKPEARKKDNIKADFKYCLLIVIGSIPAAIGGIFFKDIIETKLSSIKFLGVMFLLTALMLFFVKDIDGKKQDKDLTIKDAILIGLFQMIALVPGISRSGAVLVGCLLMKLSRESALKYTFMLYLPVSVGSLLLGIKDLSLVDTNLLVPYGIGFILSLVLTYFASTWFFGIVKKGKLSKFSIYLVALGAIILLFIK